MAQNEDWIVPGERVALYTTGGATGITVTVARVAKLTDAQIVLDNENRFRRKDLKEVGASLRSGYGPRTELRPLDDPQVREIRAKQAVSRLVKRITSAQRDRDPLALLDYIEQETALTRSRVEQLTKED